MRYPTKYNEPGHVAERVTHGHTESGFVRGECSCGWQGPERPRYTDTPDIDAALDLAGHIRGAARKAKISYTPDGKFFGGAQTQGPCLYAAWEHWQEQHTVDEIDKRAKAGDKPICPQCGAECFMLPRKDKKEVLP